MSRKTRNALCLVVMSVTLSSAALADAPAVPPDVAASMNAPRPDGSTCPQENFFRTPEEVFAARVAAINAGDIDAVMCTYAPDAVVLFPNMKLQGLVEIRAAFEQMFAMLGGIAPPPTSMQTSGEVLMITFNYHGQFFSIPDGSDTYVIRWGYIRYQTAHETMVFGSTSP